jgi:hypothetical protein
MKIDEMISRKRVISISFNAPRARPPLPSAKSASHVALGEQIDRIQEQRLGVAVLDKATQWKNATRCDMRDPCCPA